MKANQDGREYPRQGPKLPTLRQLNRATAQTAAVLSDPNATLADKHHAAELEAATLHAFWQTHGGRAKAVLELEPEVY
jgi:hypothetical protein